LLVMVCFLFEIVIRHWALVIGSSVLLLMTND
jgi:hypothetical protein